tara:strand:- start:436 stop:1650 length:1215 start_codon:yes stop_codon:yes gene_type:complete
MEENEIKEHMSEGSSFEQEETESEISIDSDSESLEESQNYSPSFWTRRKNALKLLAAFFLLATGLVLGGLFVYLSDDEPLSPSQITFQLGEAPVQNPGEEPVVEVAKAVSPSVVLVEIPTLGQGSGIILDTDGHIATNGHVVDDAESVLITLPNGRKIEADVIGSDIRRDVAVVKLLEIVEDLTPATFAPSDDIQVGQLAVAVGSPFDLSQTVTSGIVSALGRVVSSYGCEVGGFNSAECAGISTIQTDAPINPGNSGGPLADRYGRVIGMNTLIYTDGVVEGNVGVGFALPSDTVVLVAQRLIEGEPVGTAWLGISGESPDDGRGGAIVAGLTQGSPADLAGLEVGDLIVASEGRPILTMESLRADIQLRLPGMTITLDYERNNELFSTEVMLGDLDKFLAEP